MHDRLNAKKLLIVLVFMALLPSEVLSKDVETILRWFPARVVWTEGVCEFKPTLQADWTQIATDQINAFVVTHPTTSDLKKYAINIDSSSSSFFYYPVPAEKYGLGDVLEKHYYLITDKVVRKLDVRLQGTLVYWYSGNMSDSYGSLMFDCGVNEYMGFIVESPKPLAIRRREPSVPLIRSFNSTNVECGKRYKSGLVIDVEGSKFPYLIATYDFTDKKCKEPCKYLELLKVSGTEVVLLNHIDLCDL